MFYIGDYIKRKQSIGILYRIILARNLKNYLLHGKNSNQLFEFSLPINYVEKFYDRV